MAKEHTTRRWGRRAAKVAKIVAKERTTRRWGRRAAKVAKIVAREHTPISKVKATVKNATREHTMI